MSKVSDETLPSSLRVGRIIGELKSEQPGPVILFFGGIHGNEPSGVLALQQVMRELEKSAMPLQGSVYAIAGNRWALERGVRYHKEDLNRLWTADTIAEINQDTWPIDNEDRAELVELYRLIQEILKKEKGPFYFIDLHTTSSETIPFITINDSMLNRRFTLNFPVPIILGIEEYLEGPLLSYINELGYVAFAFEAGKHSDPESLKNHEAFIYLSLLFTGLIDQKDLDSTPHFKQLDSASADTRGMFEIFFRYWIQDDEEFVMNAGFANFQRVRKGAELASSNGIPIHSMSRGRIFMPLYQSQGREGFFTVRSIPSLFLSLSIVLRKWKMDEWLTWLPGINWYNDARDSLIVDRRVARFLTKPIFHLLGYRSKRRDENHWIMTAREAASRNEEYKSAPWN